MGMCSLLGVFLCWVGGEFKSQCDLGRSRISSFSLSPTTLARETHEVHRTLGTGKLWPQAHFRVLSLFYMCLNLCLLTGPHPNGGSPSTSHASPHSRVSLFKQALEDTFLCLRLWSQETWVQDLILSWLHDHGASHSVSLSFRKIK